MMGSLRAFAVGVTLCSSALAIAQPKPTDAQKQQAGDLVKKAIAKSQALDHLAAIELYLQAYAIIPQPLLLSNVGAEYQQAQKPVEALKYFCMYLDKDPTGTNASYATSQAKMLQVSMGNKDGEVCKPAKPSPPEPVVEPVVVTGTANLATPTMMPAPDGGRTLRLAGLAVGGAGIAALAVGVVYGVKAKHNSDILTGHDKAMSWPDNIAEIEAQGQSYENRQIGFLVVGGLVTITGTVLYVVGRSKKHSDERIAITPSVTPETIGVSLGGGF